jgi:hypothetical protein
VYFRGFCDYLCDLTITGIVLIYAFFTQVQPNRNEASTSCTSNVRVLKDLRVEGSQFQLNGYCLMTILNKGALLLHGDHKAGIAQVGEKKFVFSNADCLNEYVIF